MESLIALGVIGFLGYIVYVNQKNPNNNDSQPKQKRKRAEHPLRANLSAGAGDNARHHRQRHTNNWTGYIYNLRANRNLNQGNHEKALQLYNKAIKFDPKCTSHYIGRGATYMLLGIYDLAEEEFKSVIDLDDEDWLAYVNIGAIAFYEENYEKAIEYATQSLICNPQGVDAYQVRGYAYMYLHEPEKAIDDYLAWMELNPHDDTAYEVYVAALMRLNEVKQAFEVLLIRLQEKPQSHLLLNSMAWYKAKNGDYDEALVDAEKAIRIAEDEATGSYLSTRGQAKWLLGDIDGARDDFQQAIDIADDKMKPIFQMELAVLLSQLGQTEDAIKLWRESIGKHPVLRSTDHIQYILQYAQPFYEAMQELEALANADEASADS